eukprot:scaffold6673_cov126-Skeletonema_dohrnii-CCMP3373.AAC.2
MMSHVPETGPEKNHHPENRPKIKIPAFFSLHASSRRHSQSSCPIQTRSIVPSQGVCSKARHGRAVLINVMARRGG